MAMTKSNEVLRLERIKEEVIQKFVDGKEDKFKWARTSHEEFTRKVLQTMSDKDLLDSERSYEIDSLIEKVNLAAAQDYAQSLFDAGYIPVAEYEEFGGDAEHMTWRV
jgi:hypothetical protein